MKKEFLLLLKNKKLSIAIYSLLGIQFILYIVQMYVHWHHNSFMAFVNEALHYVIAGLLVYVLTKSALKAYKATAKYDEGAKKEFVNVIYYSVMILFCIVVISIIFNQC